MTPKTTPPHELDIEANRKRNGDPADGFISTGKEAPQSSETLQKFETGFNSKFGFGVYYTRPDGLGQAGIYSSDILEYCKTFIASEIAEAEKRGAQQERQFILNVLDGIDIADGQCNTKAIRHALQSRIIN